MSSVFTRTLTSTYFQSPSQIVPRTLHTTAYRLLSKSSKRSITSFASFSSGRRFVGDTSRNMVAEIDTSLPGYGKPLTASRDDDDCFPSALFKNDSFYAPLLTVREYTMMELMNRMSDKPDWATKVLDSAIVSKWKSEALATTNMDVSEKMVDESIAELKYKAALFWHTNSIEALDGVFKSDTIVSEDLRMALSKAAKPLEDVPEDQKDWHPRSDGKVLDLVHPSIYPLVYGQTTILSEATGVLEDCMKQFGKGRTLEVPETPDQKEWSNRFQWLPSDFSIPTGTEDVKTMSYINNLHPQKHADLYKAIEQVIAKTIPLWNQTLSLTDLNTRHGTPRIECDHDGYGEFSEPEPEYNEDEDEDVHWKKESAWRDRRPILQPEPKTFSAPPFDEGGRRKDESVDLRKDFGGGIQVIVKLASIYLTPESPNYGGGSWHVEGAGNENICASAIYYYESENISESLLSFRQHVEDGIDLTYEQDDHRAMETIYGFKNETASIQDLGSVVTRQGRLLTFPNVMQHRVNPFHLEDASKPGHRKILALFLVDPHQRIISTANVPPQQASWWEEHLQLTDDVLGRMPQELTDGIRPMFSKPVSLKVAKEQRLELMDERSQFVDVHNDDFENKGQFFLCEH